MMKLRGNILLHYLDQTMGKLLVGVLSLFKFKRTLPQTIQSIGLIKSSGIGDLVLLSAIVQDLRKAYPQAKITLFCGKDNAAVAPFIPSLDQVSLLDLSKPFMAFKCIHSIHVDLIIDFGQWSRIDALLAYFSSSKYSIGFKTQHQYRHLLQDASIKHSNKVHEIDNYRSLLTPLSIMYAHEPKMALPQKPSSYESVLTGPYIVFHPWPSGIFSYLKEWPEEYWLALGQNFIQRGYRIVISGGPFDVERSQGLASKISSQGELTISLAGKTSLPESMRILYQADLLVSVNTGMMHLAAVYDLPTISLNGPTSVLRWGPLGKKSLALIPENGEGQYLNLGFEYPSDNCTSMQHISVRLVLEAFEKLMGTTKNSHKAFLKPPYTYY